MDGSIFASTRRPMQQHVHSGASSQLHIKASVLWPATVEYMMMTMMVLTPR